MEILHELPGQRVWFPIPAKYGFRIELQRGALEVKSWCGLVEGSGQAHLVTPEGRCWSIKVSSDQSISDRHSAEMSIPTAIFTQLGYACTGNEGGQP